MLLTDYNVRRFLPTLHCDYVFASKSKSHMGILAAVIFLARKDQMIIFSTMVFVLNGTVRITVSKTLEI